MVSSITGSQSSNILAGLSRQGTTPSGSTASFTDQLAAALEGYLAQSGNGSNLEIDIQTTQSQNSGVRQFIVTVKDPDSAPGQTDAASKRRVRTTASAFAQPAHTPATQPPRPAPLRADGRRPRRPLRRTEINAYWAAQPPEVQKLRDVTDFGERSDLAQQLADQGYTIDQRSWCGAGIR